VLVCISIVGGYFVSSLLVANLFIGAQPKPAWSVFEAKSLIFKEQITLSITSMKNSLPHITLQATRHEPTPIIPVTTTSDTIQSAPMGFFDTIPAPTAPLAPTDIPIPTTPIFPTSTPIPTRAPIPSIVQLPSTSPSLTRIPNPTKIPKPTNTPKPTTPPEPTKAPLVIDFPKVSGDPHKQPWYGGKSLACYTTERFIKVYANGLTPNACFNNIRAHIESNLVSTTLLGRAIQIHKKPSPHMRLFQKHLINIKLTAQRTNFRVKHTK